MALTNNLKPSGFQPVGGGQLLYKWTESDLSGKTNYRVVLQFNGYTSTLPNFEFRPDDLGVVWADIAPILRSLLVFTEVASTRMINTYVKYQAVWDESSNSQVDLSGDVIYAYVGNNHYLNYRTKFDVGLADANANPLLSTGKFLSYDLVVIKNREFKLDLLLDGTLPNNMVIRDVDPSNSDIDGPTNGSTVRLSSISLTPTVLGDRVISLQNNVGDTHYAFINMKVIEECDNAVYIRWLNDFGGIQHWMFDYNQRLGFAIGSNDKAKYIDVVADGVSFEEFLMLDELNKSGLVYNENYKIGQFVQDVTNYSSPVSLVTDPVELQTLTKRVSHDFRTSFRYPLIPNTDV